MKISARIFLGYFFIVGIGVYFLLYTFMAELRPGVRQSMEEMMVDTANLLAEIVQQDISENRINTAAFTSSMQRFLNRQFNAKIWGKTKTDTGLRVYITNDKGIVIYDSNGTDIGKDYSQWRDVYLTLRGEYGARSTPTDPDDSSSTVMHVSAPIMHNNRIIGALTVAKPNISVQPFIEISRKKITRYSLFVLIASVAIGLLFALWFTNSIRKLVKYANMASAGKNIALPKISEGELSQLGTAIDKMRRELEGKDYVERYIHTLTHEMKSPLSAIKGATELLHEDMPDEKRKRFLDNVLNETERLQDFIARMLDLVSVEKRQSLQDIETIKLFALCQEIHESKYAELTQKSLKLDINIADSIHLQAERFLLKQSLVNLLNNAIAFSPNGSKIIIAARSNNGYCHISISDNGPGVPGYALKKVYDRFYSLEQPDSGKKSSGLGLSFVREVATLHHGRVEVKNRRSGGLQASLILPTIQNT